MQHMKKLIKKEYYNLMVLVTGNINSGVENVRRVYSGVSWPEKFPLSYYSLAHDKVYTKLLTFSSKWAVSKIVFDDKLVSEFDFYMHSGNWNTFCFTKFFYFKLFP